MHLRFEYRLTLLLALTQLLETATGVVYQVTSNNISNVLDSYELVLLLFYSKHCKYSVQMLPVFDSAAEELMSLYTGPNMVALGKVDALEEYDMSMEYDIGKYPTVKIVRHQIVSPREYRGQRSSEAIINFIIEELRDPINQFESLNELYDLRSSKYVVIGYFKDESHPEYDTYRKAAGHAKDYCQFHVKFASEHSANSITFQRKINHPSSHSVYSGSMFNSSEMASWFREKCVPVVLELTFDNAEEITEQGRALVILFHSAGDLTSPRDFEHVIRAELMDYVKMVTFVTAKGQEFANPVFHLNKTEADLPFIAIDTFIHMFPFENYEDLHKPGKLKEFVEKLMDGELHLYFHISDLNLEQKFDIDSIELPKNRTTSKFKDLLPSKHRYTFARDEL